MVDAPDLGSGVAKRVGSSPTWGTIGCVVMENLVYPIRALSLHWMSTIKVYELDYDEIGVDLPIQ